MCFTPGHTLFYAMTLTGVSLYSYKNPEPRKHLWVSAGWFALMEWIQYVSYTILANESYAHYNAAITMVAYFQISFQPFMVHYADGCVSPDLLQFILLMNVSDLLMAFPVPGLTWNPDPNLYRHMAGTEWQTWQGAYHLAWSVPQTISTYYRPGFNHFLTLFGPFLVIGAWKDTFIFLVTGPLMSDWIVAGDVNQTPSVWCFQSVVQVIVPLVRHSKLPHAQKIMTYFAFICLLCYNYYLVWWMGKSGQPQPTCRL